MNGIIQYRLELKKDRNISSGSLKLLQHAPGLSGLVAEMIQATEDIGTQWILDLCNGIVKGRILEDWMSSVVLPVYREGIQWSMDLTEELNCWNMLQKWWKGSLNIEFISR